MSAVAVLAFCPLAASQAHHSFSAEFDRDKPITLTGTVTKVEWTNPHARIYIDVQDDDGKVVNWDFELGPPNGLMRQGWNRNSLREGPRRHDQRLLVEGSRARRERAPVFLPDGRQVLAGSSFDVDSAAPAQ